MHLKAGGHAMQRRIYTGLLICLLGLGASAAQAAMVQPMYTTAYLQHLCDSSYDVDAGLCAGFIMGVADTLQQQKQACLNPSISPETLLANIRRAWDQEPEQPASALQSIQQIFQQRFPCP
jgi:hypothetical protein